ncbi:MAG: hypothetical protein OXG98_16505 [Gemmatimonadetes bacterium]|nr:hypothetical protein [Gemmatimonadota bacterium]
MSRRGTAESIKRIENDLYFDTDNIKVRLGRIEHKLQDFATREDIANMKISVIRWFMGSMLALAGILAGIIVTAFKWLLP